MKRLDMHRDPAELWRFIDDGLCRKADESPGSRSGLTADALADFFDRKVADVRTATNGAAPAEFVDIRSENRFQDFKPVTIDDVRSMVGEAVDKYSMLDPMPTWLFKSCVDLLVPFISVMSNSSLQSGKFPALYRSAYVTHRLKKPTLPREELSSYRPVSNLPTLSKLLETGSLQAIGRISYIGRTSS
jgi:hypothetical protein